MQSLSMQSLRELVRPVDANLAREMDHVIQSGAYVVGSPVKKPPAQPTKPERSACPVCGRVTGWEWNYARDADGNFIVTQPKRWVRTYHGYQQDAYGKMKPCKGTQRPA